MGFARCRGARAITIWMVAALGLAIILLWCFRSPRFTSGTTRGTQGSMRYVADWSITTAPFLTAVEEKRRLASLPGAKKTRVRGLRGAGGSDFTPSSLWLKESG